MTIRRLMRSTRASSAAEFALVLPLLVLLLFGIIDVGRYLWTLNEGEKATQAGVRFAVVTDIVEGGLASYSFVGKTVDGVFLTQGDKIPAAGLGSMVCDRDACTCADVCPPTGTYNAAAFDAIVKRMRAMDPAVTDENVTVEYHGSGLGFAGNPNGMDVSPLVTVQLSGMEFQPITSFLFARFNMPTISATLTAEDSVGSQSN